MPTRKHETHDDDVASEPPTSIDPYETLAIEKDATEEQIKKAYRKAALKHHPDKATGADATTAKETFQKVAFAYAILSDPRRRKRYDATGSTEESVHLEDDDFDWGDFFRAQYQEITAETIKKFTNKYKNSDEERGAILDAYKKGKGNMNVIYQTVMLSDVLEDDERFREIIDEAISKEEVEAYDKYTKETQKSKEQRIKNAERRVKEFDAQEEKKKEKANKAGKASAKPGDDESSLAALIQQRQKARGGGASFLDKLEEKHSNLENSRGKGKKRRAAEEDEPSEEAFEATAERFKKNKGRK